MIFLCNPNNPTGTIHPAWAVESFITEIHAISPDALVLVDEAYHDYVTDPNYSSGIPLIAQHPNLLVARTMSKAHGMAGLRLGYGLGQPDLIARLNARLTPFSSGCLTVAACVASLNDDTGLMAEKDRNATAKQFTLDFFESAGYKATDSQTNFIFVNLGRPAEGFRDACREQGIAVGRDFPPMEQTHCRISIGTMDEMQRAVEVFGSALGA
jgi:histidinol-phosphate aminotransferase